MTTNVSSWTTTCGLSSLRLAKTGFLPLREVLLRPNGNKHGRLSNFSLHRARRALLDHGLPHQFELTTSRRYPSVWEERRDVTRLLVERALEHGMRGRWTVIRLIDDSLLVFAFEDAQDAVLFRMVSAE